MVEGIGNDSVQASVVGSTVASIDGGSRVPGMIPDEWLEALEADELKQGEGELFNEEDNSYCCLGVGAVVCNIADHDQIKAVPLLSDFAAEHAPFGFYEDEDNEIEIYIKDTLSKLGITREEETILAALNDGGRYYLAAEPPLYYGIVEVEKHTFKEIAAILREYRANRT